mmetsp:Transcript_58022/g.138114  ORF Transcript_58022/g.138114 Transcript_58022/m.138114 type:complete len:327 (-) Transcript_58022:14-994(-)
MPGSRKADLVLGLAVGLTVATCITKLVALARGTILLPAEDISLVSKKERRRLKGKRLPPGVDAEPTAECLGKSTAGPLGGAELDSVWRCSASVVGRDHTVQQIRRWVCCADAVSWLRAQPDIAASVVTSLPDISELESDGIKTAEAYKEWFIEVASIILSKVRPKDIVIFYQSDGKMNGHLIAKAGLCYLAAEKTNSVCLWHKIAWSAAPGTVRFGRPSFTHVVAFSKEFRDSQSGSLPKFPDILDRGNVVWPRGIGVEACRIACNFVAAAGAECIVDPFCGYGSVLAMANSFGVEAVGVERSTKRCKFATQLTVGEEWSNLREKA